MREGQGDDFFADELCAPKNSAALPELQIVDDNVRAIAMLGEGDQLPILVYTLKTLRWLLRRWLEQRSASKTKSNPAEIDPS